MHLASLGAPARSSALGVRFPSSVLAPFTCPTGSTALYHVTSVPSQARSASTSAAHIKALQTSTNTLKTSARPQIPSSLTIYRTASLRANSTISDASRHEASKLDWNSFFKLRASRRRYSLASSIVSSMASTVIGVQVLSTQDLEHMGAQVMGLDPFVVLGMATAACGAAGWLIGPFLGNAVWGLVYRRYRTAVAVKEKEFFDRIKRFRVDPSSNSIANPVPDYYGEKIGSVQGYRQWLKDQRAYNRKRRSFIL
ncbi:putative presequence translocase-associated motor subunit Pam17 [Aspergillus steynii IBT 23096]|uniref:Presequence translocated-associated motor subunit PAM17 n=1 Tax=Aspergillus steynii IBT 23096 TaxID=1392250 RepID=A0A2I2FXC7_9EURO|nr:putative presequence translocase-associated motor subunit Pam17 [Aspergillus steynii IBT 23096]PLB45291.1 putative presequence translocase-associated motor subunit Pam17 [Aspergillus steynii IBT 23096]